jgi:hypothetical protein
MFAPIAKLLGWRRPTVRRFQPAPKLLLTRSCLDAMQAGLAPNMRRNQEGIIYLLGRTDGTVTLAVAVFRPQAHTTPGSFQVAAIALAPCVTVASDLSLQVVGQVHTHPGEAFHSGGDVEGARIRYAGYASVVIPNYGRRLPALSGIAAYLWRDGAWRGLADSDIVIIPGAGPWTAKDGLMSATVGPSDTAAVV